MQLLPTFLKKENFEYKKLDFHFPFFEKFLCSFSENLKKIKVNYVNKRI